MLISDSSEGGKVITKEGVSETRTSIRNLNLCCQTLASTPSTFNNSVIAKTTTSDYGRQFDVFGRYWKSFAVLALDDNGELRENG